MEFGSIAMLPPGPLMVAGALSLVWITSPDTTALELESWPPFRNTGPVLERTATPASCAKANGARTTRTRQTHFCNSNLRTYPPLPLWIGIERIWIDRSEPDCNGQPPYDWEPHQ